MKSRHIIIILFMQVCSIISFAQTSDAKFKHLTTANGLSEGRINAISKDHKGFMWFATNGGLNKYDGYRFIVYTHDQEVPASLSNNIVYSLLVDHAGILWVATGNGLDKFDTSKNEFIHSLPFRGIVRDIFEDGNKRIWAATNEGLFVLDPANGKFQRFQHISNNSNSLSDNEVNKIIMDDFGDLWIATNNGLSRFNPQTRRFCCYKNNARDSASICSNTIRTLFKDTNGNIWAGTMGGGLALYDRKMNSFVNYRHNSHNNNSLCINDIFSLAEDDKGNLWIGTQNGGISVFNLSANTFINYKNDPFDPNSLNNNSIYSLYKDDQGTMWVGTHSEGVDFHPGIADKFTHYYQLPPNRNSINDRNILAIAGGSDSNIWIGTDGGGLNRFNRNTKIFAHYLNDAANANSINSNYVLTAISVGKDTLALGLLGGGLDLMDTRTGRFTHHLQINNDKHSIARSTVGALYPSYDGNIWVGTWGEGLNLYNLKTNRFKHYENNPDDTNTIASNWTNCLLEDKKGNLWAGSSEGLDRLDRKTGRFIHYRHLDNNKRTISQNLVLSIFEDHNNQLWIGTSEGLNLFNPQNQTFTCYTKRDGLANDMIQSIMEDHRGNLWLASNGGLTKFNPKSKTHRNYDATDGLQGLEFKPNSCFQMADGEMFFGGTNGFNTFYPDSLKDNPFIPPVYITGFQVFNGDVVLPRNERTPLKEQICYTKEISLSYEQSAFSFEFAALNFMTPGENVYSYKLEGFDKSWIYSGFRRTATYTNLDPGTYFFMVKGTNDDGVWNDIGTSIKITIKPPYWLTWWFRLAVLLLIIGSGIGFYLFRINIIKKQKVLLEQKVKEQTTQLVQLNKEERQARLEAEKAQTESEDARQQTYHTNEQLEMRNKEMEQFAYVASHDLQEPLRMVTSFLTQLEKKYGSIIDDTGKKYIYFAVDGAKRMRQIILDLLEYSRIGRIEDNRENIDLNELVTDIQILFGKQIEEKKATIHVDRLPVVNGYKAPLRQVFQNLVGNALKYSKNDDNTQIKITATALENSWEFAVIDNGIGIDKQHFEKIFILFQRLHNKDEFSGTGIGLAITKKIIENMGGKIWVESEEGKGSSFYFTIPIGKADEQLLK